MKVPGSRTVVLAALLVAAVAVSVSGQTALAAYLEGSVEIQQGSLWQPLGIGDPVPARGRVRLEPGAYLEVVLGAITRRYTEQGEYTVSFESSGAGVSSNEGVRGLLENRVRRLITTEANQSREAVVAGVRASEAALAPEISWVGAESPAELIAQGLEAFNEGEIEEASFYFEDAWDFADGAERDQAGFYFAYTLYLLDEEGEAWSVLSDLAPGPEVPWYPDYALLVAEISIADGAAAVGERALRTLLDSRPALSREDPVTAQMATFLLGLAVEGPRPAEARRLFQEAAGIAPATAVAEQARARGR